MRIRARRLGLGPYAIGFLVGFGLPLLGPSPVTQQAHADSGAFPELLDVYHLLADPALSILGATAIEPSPAGR